MKFKKSILILILAVFLISIAGVCASDVNDAAVANQENAVTELIDENLKTVEDNEPAVSAADDEIVGAENDLDELSATQSTYSGLSSEVGSGGNIKLSYDYYTYDNGDTIEITIDNSVIDGNGAIIDMARSNIQAFIVSASNVTIKNLAIINANAEKSGAAIFFNKTGFVENCNFTNNTASGSYSGGGAICFNGSANVINCNFVNNTVSSLINGGGAIYFINGAGNVINCNFTNNVASGDFNLNGGGAIDWVGADCNVSGCRFVNNFAVSSGGAINWGGVNGNISNCVFVNNSGTKNDGGAVCFYENGYVTDCIFMDNSIARNGGALMFYGYGNVTNCIFVNNNARNGGAILFYDRADLTNCNFTNNSADNAGGAVNFYEDGDVTNCIFADNNAVDSGGAVIFYEDGGVVSNCNFTNCSSAVYGGAVYFDGDGAVSDCNFTICSAGEFGGAVCFFVNGDVSNCNFTNNQAPTAGGVFIYGNGDVTNSNFIDNSATTNAGAVYLRGEGEISNSNFTNNTATNGGAVYLRGDGELSHSNFIDNSAETAGAVYLRAGGKLGTSNLTNNTATNGSAVYINENGVVENCSFNDNTAMNYGGAVFINESGAVTNCNFVKNSAKVGGALFIKGIAGVTNCNFSDNKVKEILGYGGAICWNGYNGNVSGCSFVNNFGEDGGAIWWNATDGVVSGCSFVNNSAADAAAIWWQGKDGVVSGCSFVNNSAEEYGGAIYWTNDNGVISGCVFVNNSAKYCTIYFLNSRILFVEIGQNLSINDNIFLNNDADAIYFYRYDSTSNADYNWFGNNATNYDMAPAVNNVEINTWLFLNATANPDVISIVDSSEIIFKLYAYNSSEVSEYDNGRLKAVNLTLTPTNGRVNTTKTDLGKPVQYTPESVGFGTLKASIENASHTVNVVIYGINTTLDASKVITVYGSDAEFVATLTDGNNNPIEGADVDLVLVTGDTTVINTTLITDGNGQISLAVGDLDPAVYYATVSYAGNLTYNPSEKEHIKVYVQKISTSITAPDISVVYNDAGELVATLTDVDGQTISDAKVSISINDVKKTLTTDENGQVKLSTKGLTPDNYTAVISYKASTYYYGSNTTANVEVSKANTTLTAFKVITVYGSDAEFTATLKDQYGKRVSDADINIVLKNGNTTALNTTLVSDEHGRVKLPVGDLVPAVYYATVTFAGNDLYKESSTDHIKVYVQKISTNITAPDITVDYNSGGELVVTLTDANGNNISDAKIRIELNGVKKTLTTDDNGQVRLSTDGLSPGTYVAEITYKATTYYYKSNATANVVITGVVDTVLTGTKVITVYGSDAEFVATLKDVNGNPISGADVHLILLKSGTAAVNTTLTTDDNGKASFAVGDLDPAVYYATVSYDGDDSHNSTAAEHIKVYVKKISTTLTVDPDYWRSDAMMDEYRATLTDANNQPVRDAEISLSFLDYKNTLTTDANGEVVFDMSDMLYLGYGTYTAEFEYKATTYYYASNKTATVLLYNPYHYEPGYDD